MKYPSALEAASLRARMQEFDLIIDVRSPGEYALDHVPGAHNFPVLSDQERVTVGTLYKQTGSFEAKKLGAALVSQNIARHLQQAWQDMPREWKPLVYCWRGGNRSSSLALVMAKIGWPVHLLEGGYKAYRHMLLHSFPDLVAGLRYKLLCGPTGSGKSRLLRALAAQGAQVLDLEQLAAHRGSILGQLPGMPQPGQKAFESALWDRLSRFSAERPVFVEAESAKVGNVRVPEVLLAQMRAADCLNLSLAADLRVQLLLRDYAHFVEDRTSLIEKLEFLRQLHGSENVKRWQQLCTSGALPELVQDLLSHHYDPSYTRSVQRNFSHFEHAAEWHLSGISEADFSQLAQQIIQSCSD